MIQGLYLHRYSILSPLARLRLEYNLLNTIYYCIYTFYCSLRYIYCSRSSVIAFYALYPFYRVLVAIGHSNSWRCFIQCCVESVAGHKAPYRSFHFPLYTYWLRSLQPIRAQSTMLLPLRPTYNSSLSNQLSLPPSRLPTLSFLLRCSPPPSSSFNSSSSNNNNNILGSTPFPTHWLLPLLPPASQEKKKKKKKYKNKRKIKKELPSPPIEPQLDTPEY